jgi:hypothetical protein
VFIVGWYESLYFILEVYSGKFKLCKRSPDGAEFLSPVACRLKPVA